VPIYQKKPSESNMVDHAAAATVIVQAGDELVITKTVGRPGNMPNLLFLAMFQQPSPGPNQWPS
jgi:hypothetical protein